jgi:hypothetical protein
MRALCLLLILGNVLFFTWSQLIDVRVSSMERMPVHEGALPPPIVLAREAESTAEPASSAEEPEPPGAAPASENGSTTEGQSARVDTFSCTSVGPFADLPQAAQAQAALRAVGFSPRQRVEQGELWVGYWVSVQGFASRESAEEAMVTLRANGITDVYLMPASEQGYIVSLGVFSDYQRAQRRADQVRTVGLTPRIDDRTRTGSVYWLDVDLQEPGQIIDSSIFQTVPGKITRLEMRACPAAG